MMYIPKRTGISHIRKLYSAGCACGLVGPNGAGKTTLLKLLLNILPPTSGEVRVFGLSPAKHALEIKQRCGYVPEKHHIYEWMKVGQVLKMTAGIYESWDATECSRLLELLKLPTSAKVKSLSRGELAMIIALAPKPELLLLDEPTSGLDPLIREELLDAIGEKSVLAKFSKSDYRYVYLSPNNDRVAVIDHFYKGTTFVTTIFDKGEITYQTKARKQNSRAVWIDDERLAFVEDDKIISMNADGSDKRQVYPKPAPAK